MSTPLTIVTGAQTEVLRTKTAKVRDPLTPEIQKLITDMFEAMHKADGLGLAAPQIDISLRMCVIEIEGNKMVFINPQLTSLSREKIVFEEGCLSLPGQFLPIERSERVTVRFQDEHGTDRKIKASGLLAIALQHEVDHLEGILIIDRYKKQKIKHYDITRQSVL
jgi:peptide deformylase